MTQGILANQVAGPTGNAAPPAVGTVGKLQASDGAAALAAPGNVTLTAASLNCGIPIYGLASPYGVHGVFISAMTDGNYVVPASEYIFDMIEVPATLTLLAGRNFDLPLPATEAASYSKCISNQATGVFSLTIRVAGGAGATVVLLHATKAEVIVRPGGVYLKSAAL